MKVQFIDYGGIIVKEHPEGVDVFVNRADGGVLPLDAAEALARHILALVEAKRPATYTTWHQLPASPHGRLVEHWAIHDAAGDLRAETWQAGPEWGWARHWAGGWDGGTAPTRDVAMRAALPDEPAAFTITPGVERPPIDVAQARRMLRAMEQPAAPLVGAIRDVATAVLRTRMVTPEGGATVTILDPKAHSVSLYDSATGESLHTDRVVDVSAVCPKLETGSRALILYARAERGRIVQFILETGGSSIGLHTFLDEPSLAEDAERPARWFGLDAVDIIRLAREHAPETP